MRTLPNSLIGGCLCGASAQSGQFQCVKCRARARWRRRKFRHDAL